MHENVEGRGSTRNGHRASVSFTNDPTGNLQPRPSEKPQASSFALRHGVEASLTGRIVQPPETQDLRRRWSKPRYSFGAREFVTQADYASLERRLLASSEQELLKAGLILADVRELKRRMLTEVWGDLPPWTD